MIQATARVETHRARRYLGQLCKHFAHKVPARWDDSAGEVEFPHGNCSFAADPEGLEITCSAPDRDGLTKVQRIVADHVRRFGWREGLSVAWSEPSPTS